MCFFLCVDNMLSIFPSKPSSITEISLQALDYDGGLFPVKMETANDALFNKGVLNGAFTRFGPTLHAREELSPHHCLCDLSPLSLLYQLRLPLKRIKVF